MLYKKVLLLKNRSITLPGSEPDCRFSVAGFLSGGYRLGTWRGRFMRGLRRGEQRHPGTCLIAGKGAAMIHGAKVQRQVNASFLVVAVATPQLGCEPPL
jgi:hypothetical protein